jgi:hypothetical protein
MQLVLTGQDQAQPFEDEQQMHGEAGAQRKVEDPERQAQ